MTNQEFSQEVLPGFEQEELPEVNQEASPEVAQEVNPHKIPDIAIEPMESKKEVPEDRVREMPKLTLKQEKFVEALVGEANGNQSEAVRMAGYKVANGGVAALIGSENIRKHNVQQALEIRRQEVLYRMQAKAHDALSQMFNIIDSPDVAPQTKLNAIKDLLDRVGTAPTQKTEVQGNISHTAEVHERAKLILAERIKAKEVETLQEELPEGEYLDIEAVEDDAKA